MIAIWECLSLWNKHDDDDDDDAIWEFKTGKNWNTDNAIQKLDCGTNMMMMMMMMMQFGS